jgi:hypothetical protein
MQVLSSSCKSCQGSIVDADEIIAPKSVNIKTGMLTKMHAVQASRRPQRNKSKNAAVMAVVVDEKIKKRRVIDKLRHRIARRVSTKEDKTAYFRLTGDAWHLQSKRKQGLRNVRDCKKIIFVIICIVHLILKRKTCKH